MTSILRPLIPIAILTAALATGSAQPADWPDFSKPHSDIPVHDPVMAKQGDTYYPFCTGMGIGAWPSPDLKEWVRLDPVFSEPPA